MFLALHHSDSQVAAKSSINQSVDGPEKSQRIAVVESQIGCQILKAGHLAPSVAEK